MLILLSHPFFWAAAPGRLYINGEVRGTLSLVRTLVPRFQGLLMLPLMGEGVMEPRGKSRDSPPAPEGRSSMGRGWFWAAAADVYWGPVSLCQILGALPPVFLASASFVAVEL